MTIEIRSADLLQLPQLAPLFDAYRQFYGQPSDLNLARDFLTERISHGQSQIFVAYDGSDEALGFVQLYPSFSSVSACPIWILNDLYVVSAGRRQGVARALMAAARDFAEQHHGRSLVLSTQVQNTQAQTLYESLGYERESGFYHYRLPLGEH
ncbi:GNAT family N-acetyltransferase [Gallaecimonas sp. GXIMD4217]|uniref:GNAT family N-acetyltransferase n=1 Tax=Gallaecimonas sp. GXIMD4217 TaxID=3131927 RepID=UPI00311ABC9C